jgi:hypothetical protein
MLKSACLGILLLAATTAWCQQNTVATADAKATDTTATDTADLPMATPPPVSGEAYSTSFTTDTRSNFISGGLTLGTGYSSNILGGSSSNPTSDVSYTIWPSVGMNYSTSQMNAILRYSPGFTFYQHSSGLNQADQNVGVDFKWRFTPQFNISLRDSFQKTSNVFNQPDPLSATVVSGGVPASNTAIIAPIANQLHNTAGVEMSYQLGAASMIGASGTFTSLAYPDPSEAVGVYDSNSEGFSAFYSLRVKERHYLGVSYQYQNTDSYPGGTATGPQVDSTTKSQTVFMFYTLYLKPNLSVSVSGGPQHVDAVQYPQSSSSWSPLFVTSLSWQGEHTSIAGSYSRTVTGGGGLMGTFQSNILNLSGRWQFSRNWTVGLAGGYSDNNTLTPTFIQSTPGGHSLSGTISLRRPLGENFSFETGYTRLQQNYSGVQAVSTTPNVNSVFLNVSYHFNRPLEK